MSRGHRKEQEAAEMGQAMGDLGWNRMLAVGNKTRTSDRDAGLLASVKFGTWLNMKEGQRRRFQCVE